MSLIPFLKSLFQTAPVKPLPAKEPDTRGPFTVEAGARIKSHGNQWEILSVVADGSTFRFKALAANPQVESYIDIGAIYTCHRHSRLYASMPLVYEVPENEMKRSTSQLLLFIWETGPEIELDC
jgi:hypothetical protein